MKTTATKKKGQPTMQLSHQVARVATALEKQNHMGWRFASGMVMGIGTALGASFIASLILLIFTSLLQSIGLEPFLEAVGAFESQ